MSTEPAVPSAQPRDGISRLALGGALIALVLESIFAASTIISLHQPLPHAVPYGMVAPPAILQGYRIADGFALTSEPGVAALLQAIDQRSLYGGLVFTEHGLQLIVADAASLTVAQALTVFAEGIATAQKVPLRITHTHPLPAGDPRGVSDVYLVFAWVFGGFLCATTLSTRCGNVCSNRRYALPHIALLAGFAVLSGILGTVIAEPMAGALDGNSVQLAAIGSLIVFAVAVATLAIQLLLDVAGTLAVLIAFVLVGYPSAGGSVPPEYLPSLWRAIGPLLPTGAGLTLVRNTLYFGGAAICGALVVLTVYALAGTALLVGFATFHRPRSLLGNEMESAAPAAAAGARPTGK